jgi:hypothetical protein
MGTSSFISSTKTGECLIFSTHQQDMQQVSIAYQMIMDAPYTSPADREFLEIVPDNGHKWDRERKQQGYNEVWKV